MSDKERTAMDRFLRPFAAKVYKLTGLTMEELLSDDIYVVFVRLSERFAERLGINGQTIWSSHKTMARGLFAQAS